MESQGFHVTPHYLGLETAWRAQFSFGEGGRTIGVNSEMDALPCGDTKGASHSCGHNLIAVAGVGVAVALKRALEVHNTTGTVVLLGTPGMPPSRISFLISIFDNPYSRGRWRWKRNFAPAGCV